MRFILLFFMVLLVGCGESLQVREVARRPSRVSLENALMVEFSQESPYVCRVRYDTVSIRLLVLKHAPDDIADIDGDQAVQAAKLAETQGLSIETIGNHHINKDGFTDSMVWGSKYNLNDLEGLKKFINEQAKIQAEPGDTLIIYTIGHGSGSGSVMRLGQRGPIMKMLAEVAAENEQEMLWWQLSCHAAAKLPPISSLTPKQQEYFSMTASSSANELSYFNTQGRQFKALFLALAQESPEIDPNGDMVITRKELSDFLIRGFGKRGELVYARSDDEPIFGLVGGIANSIPIVDWNNPQQDYDRTYIPFPRKR